MALVKLLVAAGAPVRAVAANGRTAEEEAKSRSHGQVALFLRQRK